MFGAPLSKKMLSAKEVLLADDSKYKQYTNSVEKALKSFEASNEWADLISALAKLLKVTREQTCIACRELFI